MSHRSHSSRSAPRCSPCSPCPPRPQCSPCKVTKSRRCDPCVDKCDPCNKPYTVSCSEGCHGCTSIDLCVCPPACLMKDSSYRALFCCLKDAIIYYRIDTLLPGVVDSTTYDALYAMILQIAGKVSNGRVVVTLSDGTVVMDTSKGATNTYANYQSKVINENHNSRVAIFDAVDKECGVGYETKLSSSTGNVERYVAIRLGRYLNGAGCIRLSQDLDD